jgi:hypothetical protein
VGAIDAGTSAPQAIPFPASATRSADGRQSNPFNRAVHPGGPTFCESRRPFTQARRMNEIDMQVEGDTDDEKAKSLV